MQIWPSAAIGKWTYLLVRSCAAVLTNLSAPGDGIPPVGAIQTGEHGMNWRDAALAMAGVIGSGVAVFHGVLVQQLMVRPLEESLLADERSGAAIRRLVPLLLHFSTASWFLGGLALIAAANWFERGARLATGLCVGGLYFYGAIANLWGTRGLHPGWVLMAVALVLIVLGVGEPQQSSIE